MVDDDSGDTRELSGDEVTRADPDYAVPPTPRDAPMFIGRFAVLRKLGQGAMGVVYSAYDEDLDRRVAIKVLKRSTPASTERMRREAQAMAKVSHPNVATVYEVGTWEGNLFLVIEFVKGLTLRDWKREQSPSWAEILHVYGQAGAGLAAAHDAGLVHRDFKPDNVMVGADGRTRVLDFGLAGSGEADPGAAAESMIATRGGPSLFENHLTATGMVMGTPAYMSPEQFLAQKVGPASDQFSFCVAVWEALYGERPFAGDTIASVRANVQQGKRRSPPKDVEVPARIHGALEQGLHADPMRRHADMRTLLARLAEQPRGMRRGVGFAGMAAAAAIAVWASSGEETVRPALCTGAQDRLAGVWGQAEAAELQANFVATELAFAPDSAARVRDHLDRYARGWVEAHTEACEATRVRGEQSEELLDARMRCLEGRRRSLSSLVSALDAPDPDVVENAIEAVLRLPALEPCSDDAYVRAEIPPPEDAAVAAEVEALRFDLAEVAALEASGQWKRGWEVAQRVEGDAQAVDYPPLQAEVALHVGLLGLRVREYDRAEKGFRAAYFAARRLGDTETAARASVKMVRTLGLFKGDHPGGLEWSEHAAAEVARLGDRALEAERLNHVGVILHDQGEYDQAVSMHREALAIRREVLGSAHPDVGKSLTELGISAFAAGDWDGAKATVDEGIEVLARTLGDDHPDLGNALENAGAISANSDHFADAVAFFDGAAEVFGRAYGVTSSRRATELTNAAMMAHLGGDHEGEKTRFDAAIAVLEASDDESAPRRMASTRLKRSMSQVHDGDLVAGVAGLEAAVAEMESLEAPGLGNAYQNLATGLAKANRHEEAASTFRHALELYEAEGESGLEIATTHFKYAEELRALGKRAAARERVELALAALPSVPDEGEDRWKAKREAWTEWLKEN